MVILRNKRFSKKEDREIVPHELAEKAKKEGVVQEYNGSWRIISFKTNPPTFWSAHYTSKASAEAGLRGYQQSKH